MQRQAVCNRSGGSPVCGPGGKTAGGLLTSGKDTPVACWPAGKPAFPGFAFRPPRVIPLLTSVKI